MRGAVLWAAVAGVLALGARAQEARQRPAGSEAVDGLRGEELLRARNAIRAAVDADPSNTQLLLHLGFTEHKLGNLEAAQAAFEKVVGLRASESSAHYMLALIYEKKRETQRAVAAWEACLEHSNDPNLREIARKHLKELRP